MLAISLSVALAGVFFVAASLLRPNPFRRALPPGPEKGHFLVHLLFGNFFSFPRSHLHETFADWAQEHGTCNFVEKRPDFNLNSTSGDVVYVKFLRTNIFILSNREKATDLLDRRGNIHSRRPRSVWSEMYVLINDLALFCLINYLFLVSDGPAGQVSRNNPERPTANSGICFSKASDEISSLHMTRSFRVWLKSTFSRA